MFGHNRNHDTIEQWLGAEARAEALHSLAFAGGSALLGGLVMTVSFLVAYGLVWFLFNALLTPFAAAVVQRPIRVSNPVVVGGAILLLGSVFWANARLSRAHQRQTQQRPRPAARSLTRPRRRPALGSLLAYPGASARFSTDLLFTGPRLMTIAASHCARAWHLARLDRRSCARVIDVLRTRNARVPLTDLEQQAHVTDLLTVLDQLRDFDGVIFLFSKPAGLSLTGDWRVELAELRSPEPVPDVARAPIAEALPGLSSKASVAEVRDLFRRRVRAYGANRIIREDNELQRMAQEQLAAVNAAYEAFLARHGKTPAPQDRRDVERIWEELSRQSAGSDHDKRVERPGQAPSS